MPAGPSRAGGLVFEAMAVAKRMLMSRINTESTGQASAALSIRDIVIRFGTMTVLDRVSIDAAPGEFLTLLGPSGSGKTTLLMSIAGFVDIDSGQIKFGKADLSLLPPHKRNLGVVFQSYALFPHMTVAENVAYPLRVRKVQGTEIGPRVAEALNLVKLSDYGARRVNELSGGQRQRVALARAIVFKPAIMLMDEPLSALDKKLREHMQGEIRRLHDRLGVTTIYVTHDQREALTMSDRVAIMDGGKIAQIDTPHELYKRPRTRFVADFIGVSSFLPLETRGGITRCLGRTIETAPGAAVPEGGSLLVLRPESVRLSKGSMESGNTLSGIVETATFEGDALVVDVAIPGADAVKAKLPTELLGSVNPGDPVTIFWRPEDTVIVAEDRA